MNLKIFKADASLIEKIKIYVKEMSDLQEPVDSRYLHKNRETADEYLLRLQNLETLPQADWIPESTYWGVLDDKVVGRISLRHRLEGNLVKIGGHIGYQVHPAFRKRGIATEMLRLMLQTPKAREIGNLLLTCSPENLASNKTILKNGGHFTRKIFIDSLQEEKNHYWIHLQNPRFETARLHLREITVDDAETYQKNFAHWEVIRMLARAVPWPYPENGCLDFIEKVILPNQGKDQWWWGIFLKSEPSEIIGVVQFYRKPSPDNRGFWLAQKHWGKGMMHEVLKPLMDYAFTQLGFEKLYLSNALGNEQSRRIKEKGGARFLKTEPAEFVDPIYTHRELWEITRENWFLKGAE